MMTIYKRVEIVDGETKEPVQFVALHPFAWPEDYTPTAAFVEDEDATARLTAADALAKMLTSNHVVSILALLTDIAFSCDKINKNEYREHMETARKLSDALREYREVSGA